ncbi:hypothetical protein P1X14_04305 [Sphingomonas sp. AOB5]|uniref:hypothetical protein n=1 Tax=Sphingomonas sp. AOB5 TaxID=3034017 RepID=UPI0023F626B9|nr:hypothetical protein [Sphingomonas sp. AOB5]MDF7774459.1 hypothetical protein [Sphingomonas sp. AOB5]
MILGGLLLMALVQSAPDPLAPAREGKLQCTMPNVAKKKCLAMTRYTPTPTGHRNTTTVIISAAPLVTMEMSSEGTTEGEAVCGVLRHEDILAATVRIDGQPMSPADAAPLIDRMIDGLQENFGRKICTCFRAEGDLMVSEAEIDGTPRADMKLSFLWVRPEDGYTVGWEP